MRAKQQLFVKIGYLASPGRDLFGHQFAFQFGATANDRSNPEVRDLLCPYQGMGAWPALGKVRIWVGIALKIGGGVSPKLLVPRMAPT